MEIILGEARRCWSEGESGRSWLRRLLTARRLMVARRHNISRSMLFGWRKQFREALKCTASTSTPIGFTPAAIASHEPSEPPPAASPAAMSLIGDCGAGSGSGAGSCTG